ncbi:MAG: glycosyltransferase [Parachlamydiales bacterium]|nr:glycosyltransferase [Parachlamydiales bacterium]
MQIKKEIYQKLITAVLFFSIAFALLYMTIRFYLLSKATHYWYEDLLSVILLFAELFILVHSIGYILEIVQVVSKYKTLKDVRKKTKKITKFPPIAIIIPSYKEPLNVLKRTLTSVYNLSYPNKHVVFLDDTRYDQYKTRKEKEQLLIYKKKIEALCKELDANLFRRHWRGAKAGIINDFLDFIQNKPKEGFQFKNYSRKKLKTPKYITIFDADQNPYYDFLDPLVSEMEENSKIAFIQTPQYYTNFQENRVARAASLQQVVFFEYVCIGKSAKNAMFCCGTNVILRVDALTQIGGFDEDSVTEDCVTSFKLHLNGWSTRYHSKVSAFGLGPEDLKNHFKQQYRWALGTLGLFKLLIREFFKNPKKLSLKIWWEYFLSTTYYFIGLVYLILIIMPGLYLLTGVPTYFSSPLIYVLIFIPYIVITLISFFWTLRKRSYHPKDVFLGQFLMVISFSVYIKAAINAMLGRKAKFEVTSKGRAYSMPLKALWPQISIFVFLFVATIWGANKIYFERQAIYAYTVNMFWCFYHFFILTFIFYFNKPIEKKFQTEKI